MRSRELLLGLVAVGQAALLCWLFAVADGDGVALVVARFLLGVAVLVLVLATLPTLFPRLGLGRVAPAAAPPVILWCSVAFVAGSGAGLVVDGWSDLHLLGLALGLAGLGAAAGARRRTKALTPSV
ncbi:hypothetical protein [Nocardioides sp. WS12]|uniref:hypothetical protein n=1 Tax=Nocardioides sp. WS12 TaxID=2486272 RepID=UPI0015F7DA4A|nr:hypothetical protein [Nocardioides sp. WS12]